jgi:hypothetical protein
VVNQDIGIVEGGYGRDRQFSIYDVVSLHDNVVWKIS